MTKSEGVPVSTRALYQRINRALAGRDGNSGRRLRNRGQSALQDLGTYYVLDIYRNFVIETHVDPEELGREL